MYKFDRLVFVTKRCSLFVIPCEGGHDTKLELSIALSRKMLDIERKKRIESKKENWVATDRLRDDIRLNYKNVGILLTHKIKLTKTFQDDLKHKISQKRLAPLKFTCF